MALNYLLDPMFQIENSAGKPATDGWLEVYIHGTRTKYYCASNFDGTLHPFKIKLDSLGSNIVLADDGQAYDVYAYNRFGSLLMSRYNVQPGSGGSGSIITGEMQHWLGMYGPTYTHFPGDDAGHTLGIPRQSVDYDGDFIDHIETAPYPDGDVPAYIYLKPGLYHIDCVIRYQQDSGDIKNTLDEVLIYTGHGNANEDVAYQLDASGPDTNGNRHCLKQSFIRKVTEEDGGLLYFAPGTPTDWTDAYIQTLSIVKLDSMIYGKAGIPKVTHDETMTGDGTPDNPLSIQDALDGKQDTLTGGNGITIINNIVNIDSDSVQDKLTPGEGITIDSDGVISTEGRMYTEGWGIDIDNDNNVISADPEEVQKKLTAGVGINLDSDGNISGNYRGGYNIEVTGNTINKLGHKLIATNNVSYTYCKVFDFTWQYVYGRGQTVFTATHYGGNFVTFSVTLIRAVGTSYTVAWPYVVAASPNMIKPTAFIEKLEIRESGNRIIGYLKLRNFSQNQFWLDWEGHSDAGYVTFTPQLTNSPEGEIAWTCEVSNYNVPYYQDEINSNFQQKLTAGDNIYIDSNGVISATANAQVQSDWDETDSESPSYIMNKPDLSEYQKELTAGEGINIDSDGTISVDLPPISPLVAGENISIVDSDGSVVISATGSGSTYTAGNGINIDANNEISVDTTVIQEKLTAGQNITIDSDGVISAEGDHYSEGTGIDIDSNGIISVDPSTVVMQSDMPEEEEVEFEELDLDDYQKAITAGNGITLDSDGNIGVDTGVIQEKLTAGQNIDINSDGVISVELPEEEEVEFEELDLDDYQTKLTAGQNITIDSDGVISATGGGSTYTAGNGIDISGDGTISVDTDEIQEKLTAGSNIDIDSDGVISAELPAEEEVDFEELDLDDYQTKLTAGEGITIINNVISVNSNSVQEKLTAGEGINIDSDGTISVDLPPVAPLVAGDNVSIVDSDGSVVISATGGGSSYTAGTGIDITSDVISVDTSVVQEKLTAGQNITIDSDGVISAAGGGESNVFIATVNSTSYDDIKAALDAGKVVIAKDGRIQLGVVSSWTDMWGNPAVIFGVMADQGQSGYPKRLQWYVEKTNDTSRWVQRENSSIALKTDLNSKQDKLTAGDGISIDSNGGISVKTGNGLDIDNSGNVELSSSVLPPYDTLPIEAGNGIAINIVNGKLVISLA